MTPNMAQIVRLLALGVALLATRAAADCQCAGLDYTNGGSYFLDQSSTQLFTFTSLFEGANLVCRRGPREADNTS